MKSWMFAAVLGLAVVSPAMAQKRVSSNPLIDFGGYMRIASQTQGIRAKRLLPLEAFKARAAEPQTLLLDARSAQAFLEGHIEGAVNLPLPDFTATSLREIVGDNPNRRILIYCNNNFTNNVRPVPTKVVQVALNIQTFINLRAYGFTNVWELADAVDFNDPRVGWIGSGRPIATNSVLVTNELKLGADL